MRCVTAPGAFSTLATQALGTITRTVLSGRKLNGSSMRDIPLIQYRERHRAINNSRGGRQIQFPVNTRSSRRSMPRWLAPWFRTASCLPAVAVNASHDGALGATDPAERIFGRLRGPRSARTAQFAKLVQPPPTASAAGFMLHTFVTRTDHILARDRLKSGCIISWPAWKLRHQSFASCQGSVSSPRDLQLFRGARRGSLPLQVRIQQALRRDVILIWPRD